ncbi:MAG: type II toxin-antitoxin system RelE family toxin [Methyloceanibacter sp.]
MPQLMRLVLERAALRRLGDLPKPARAGLLRRLRLIAADPFAKHANVKRYKEGGPNCFRLRQGQWRAIYEIDREAQEMRVQAIDTRGSVYR